MTERSNVPCKGCTLCCRKQRVLLFTDMGDVIENYEYDAVEVAKVGTVYQLKHKPNGDCIYLEADGCSIHERAPAVCREYDCRMDYVSKTREQRKRMIAKKQASKEMFEAGRKRLSSLSAKDWALVNGLKVIGPAA